MAKLKPISQVRTWRRNRVSNKNQYGGIWWRTKRGWVLNFNPIEMNVLLTKFKIIECYWRRNDWKFSDDDVDDTDIDTSYVTARPRRLSEVNIVKKTRPIPKGSALFIFSQKNRYDLIKTWLQNKPWTCF